MRLLHLLLYTSSLSADNATTNAELVSTAPLYVTIIDINDNSPMFVSPPNAGTVVESDAVGRLVSNFQAIDADSGSNGQVRLL